MNNLQTVARKAALKLQDAATKHKNWTPEQNNYFTRAFNSLQRLAGKKIELNAGKLRVVN